MTTEKDTRCWPGYEPVPGKKPNTQGSCRPKPDSRSTPGQKKFKAKRREQLDEWQEEHPKTRRSAAQHLHGPDGEPSSQKSAAAKKKIAAKKKSAKRTPAATTKRTRGKKITKRTGTKRTTARSKRPAKKAA
jgi:hypothetical protein